MIDIFNGNCLDKIRAIEDKSISLVVTDPPYWHNKAHGIVKRVINGRLKSNLYMGNCDMINKMSNFTPDKMVEFLDEIPRIMKIMNCYLFCNDSQISTYGKWAEEHDYNFSVLVWRKPLSVINTNRFSQNAEFVCRIYDTGTGLNYVENKDYYDRVINDKPLVGTDKVHPTQKPESIFRRFIELSSKKDDIVLDPFMGSGVCGVACVNLERNFIGCEIEPKYFDIAKKRIETQERKKSFLM